MKLQKLTPNVMVEDVNKTLEFYREVLDFEVLATVPESGQLDWAMVKNGDTELMFQSRANLTAELPAFTHRPIIASMTFYIGVENVDVWYAKLKAHQTIVQDMHTTFYGAKEFGFLDCNGYVLVFSQNNTSNSE